VNALDIACQAGITQPESYAAPFLRGTLAAFFTRSIGDTALLIFEKFCERVIVTILFNLSQYIPCFWNLMFVATDQAAACCLTAESNSSLVNGFVRYRSDPTTRPRAWSNRPSLLVSITTGVDRY
jgi:hypothetical protein